MFEDQGHSSEPACEALLKDVWADALTICGIEMHRRTLSLAHNADFEEIENIAVRAPLEARNLMMGADLILKAETIADTSSLVAIARDFNKRNIL